MPFWRYGGALRIIRYMVLMSWLTDILTYSKAATVTDCCYNSLFKKNKQPNGLQNNGYSVKNC